MLFSICFIIQGIIQNTTFSFWFIIIQNTTCSVWFRIQGIIKKMSRVLFSVLFTIQGIIQNTSCSVWFSIQRIVIECQGYYSASGSRFRVLFKIRPAASGSGFSVLLKMSRVLFSFWFSIQGIIQNTVQRLVQDSWFRIQRIIKNVRGIIQRLVQYSGYYSKYGAASGSGFCVLLKNVQGIIQRLVQYSGYYSKYDLQHLLQDSAYYSEMARVLFSVWFSIQPIIRGIIQNTTSVLFGVWSRIQDIIIKCAGYSSASSSIFGVLFRELLKIRPGYYSAPGSGLRVLVKKYSRVLFCVWIIKNWLGYYSVSGSVFSMLTCLRFQRTQLKLMFMLHVLFYLAIAINS